MLSIGVVTISDRASRGEYEDKYGPAIEAVLSRILISAGRPERRMVPDEQTLTEAALRDLADEAGCPLIVATGGTGPAPRDVTPEATAMVFERILPGFGELMRNVSLRAVPTAIAECLHAVFPTLPCCIDLIGGARLDTDPAVYFAFRPV